MIKCCVCNKELGFVNHTHLLIHGMTTKDYLFQFPTADLCGDEYRQHCREMAITRGAIPPNLSFEERSAARKGKKYAWKDPIGRGKAISQALATSPARHALNERMKTERLGENNPAYKGGCKYLYVSAPAQNEIRDRIRVRDNRTCVVCNEKGWCVHHIDHNVDNWSDDNLITLCNKHHSATNHRKTVEQVKQEYLCEMLGA